MDGIEPVRVKIPPIPNIDGAGFNCDMARYIDIMHAPVCYFNNSRD